MANNDFCLFLRVWVLFGQSLVWHGGTTGIRFLSEGYRSVWLCVFGVFVLFFLSVTFRMPIARGAGIFFSGSGQRLIFLITYFLYIFFFFSWVPIPGGFFYILFGSCGVYLISISVWGAQAGGGRIVLGGGFLLVLTLFVVLYDYGVQEDLFLYSFLFFSDIGSCGASS